jgi:hypothetical protein
MLWRLIPVVMTLAGLAAGIGAGLLLRPDPPDPATDAAAGEEAAEPPASSEPPEYVKLNNQFVVPIVDEGKVAAMVILSLTLQVAPGASPDVFAAEPKLRDVFLQVLFDHANAGGFRGSFTDADNLLVLRRALNEAALAVLGDRQQEVLITDIVRQDS